MAVAAISTTLLVTGCSALGGASGTANTQATINAAAKNLTSTTAAAAQSPLLGKQAPSFQLEVYGKSGQMLALKDVLKSGQPVIVNAFASWCPPCNEEAPDLKKFAEQYKGKIKVIGVDMTDYDTVSGLKQFVSKYGLPYTVLLDKKGVFEKYYDVAAYPTTFGINAKGQIVAFHLGYMSKQDMKNMAQQLLSQS